MEDPSDSEWLSRHLPKKYPQVQSVRVEDMSEAGGLSGLMQRLHVRFVDNSGEILVDLDVVVVVMFQHLWYRDGCGVSICNSVKLFRCITTAECDRALCLSTYISFLLLVIAFAVDATAS